MVGHVCSTGYRYSEDTGRVRDAVVSLHCVRNFVSAMIAIAG